MFIPEKAFELLARQGIEKLKDPALQCAELVLDELIRIAGAAETKTLARYATINKMPKCGMGGDPNLRSTSG